MSVSLMVVFVGGLVESKLAPGENFSTRPIADMLVGSALTILPKNESP
ncbi:hypothetical protein [uncultured Sunxiuqinia sp.]|nr:hypothetical protein [uncultured Sunxiuqinia sp.]